MHFTPVSIAVYLEPWNLHNKFQAIYRKIKDPMGNPQVGPASSGRLRYSCIVVPQMYRFATLLGCPFAVKSALLLKLASCVPDDVQ